MFALVTWITAGYVGNITANAVYDVSTDDNGFFVIVNDEAYRQEWGEALL